MNQLKIQIVIGLAALCSLPCQLMAQGFGSLQPVENEAIYEPNSLEASSRGFFAARDRFDIMDTRNNRLIDYRRMFRKGVTPTPQDMVGNWRGVNKGIVELVGYKQFIKEIKPECCRLTGDNIMVDQVSNDLLRCMGWQVKTDPASLDGLKRNGKFAIERPRGVGAFKHGVIFNYRKGDNRKLDPARLLVDKVVMIDQNHMLGRVTANFGPLRIPLAYFVLERMSN